MTIEPIAISVPDGGRLAGDYLAPTGSAADFALVWIHGFGSHRGGEKSAAIAAECAHRGWAFVACDFRGHGGSSGTMLERRARTLLADLDAIGHFLAGRGHTRLGLVGSSMGGFAAAWFARSHPVVGCVLLAPAFGFLHRRWDRLGESERAEWRRTGRLRVTNDWVDAEIGYGLLEERDRFRPDDLAANWNVPTLIFHGAADEVIPAAETLEFLQRVRYPHIELRLIPDGDHRLTAHKDDIAAEVGRFFASLIE